MDKFLGLLDNEWLGKVLPPLLLSMFGGLADWIMSDDHSLGQFLSSIFLAGFTGYLLYLLGTEVGVSDGMLGVTCGIGGLASKPILLLLRKTLLSRLRWMTKNGDG